MALGGTVPMFHVSMEVGLTNYNQSENPSERPKVQLQILVIMLNTKR